LKFNCLYIIVCIFASCLDSLSQDIPIKDDQDSLSTIEVSGSIDGYYRYGLLQSTSQTAITLNYNEPSLGSINLAINYNASKYGGLLHFAAGPRADQSYNLDKGNILRYIRQSYVYYQLSSNVKLSAGTSGALPGYENDEPHLNPVYSTSFLNSLIPGIHTGIWVDYFISDNWIFNIGVYNDMDRRIDVSRGKHIGSILTYESTDDAISLSYVTGREGDQILKIIDLLWDHKLGKNDAVALELLYTSYQKTDIPIENFYGFGAYYIHDVSDDFSINLRGEYMKDNAGFSFGVENVSVWDLTLTCKYQVGDFLFMPEIRYDRADRPSFLDGDNDLNNENFHFLLGLIYYIGEVR